MQKRFFSFFSLQQKYSVLLYIVNLPPYIHKQFLTNFPHCFLFFFILLQLVKTAKTLSSFIKEADEMTRLSQVQERKKKYLARCKFLFTLGYSLGQTSMLTLSWEIWDARICSTSFFFFNPQLATWPTKQWTAHFSTFLDLTSLNFSI